MIYSTTRTARPALHPMARTAATLQRTCGCGSHTYGGGKCSACSKDERRLQRGALQARLDIGASNDPLELEADRVADHVLGGSARTGGRLAAPRIQRLAGPSAGAEIAPGSVERVLAESGRPIEKSLRLDMERRFGHDFTGVRLHSGAAAERSARDVHARAYTVGRDIVFGAGQFAPGTAGGRRLIAHELTHVVQQSGTARLQRDAIPVDLVPVSPEEKKKLDALGIDLPRVSDETWRDIGGIADNAGKPLSAREKKKIEKILSDAKVRAAAPMASVRGAKFVLHDTSAEVGEAAIKEQEGKGRGPMGSGVAAYVPRDTAATITRPNFYESKRPSTTEYEKTIDVVKQDDRETAVKDVWRATAATARASALDAALAGQGLTADEVKKIKGGAETFLKGVESKVDGAKTTAAWAAGEICSAAKADAKAVADTGKEKELAAGCKQLEKYFPTRSERVGSLVPVEIVQVGVKSDKGNKNTCDPDNPNIKPIPNPPYTDNQYAQIALLYLRAALTAGAFPETTTHFVLDAFDRGHCDPRCFDLMKLYDTIAATIGHAKGCTYGIKPQFGRSWGKDTIWWSDKICGGPHP